MIAGIVDVRSHHSVAETVDRLEALAKRAGLTVFARIDFSADAVKSGLSLRPMQQLVFGNPKAGTPLLVASPRAGLDLPLKALVWEDGDGAVWIASRVEESRVATNQRSKIGGAAIYPLHGRACETPFAGFEAAFSRSNQGESTV